MQTDKCVQSGYLTQVCILSTGPVASAAAWLCNPDLYPVHRCLQHQLQSGYLTQVCILSTGPCGISCRVSLSDIPLEEGMILSDGTAADEFGLLSQSSWNCRRVLRGSSWLLHHCRIKTCTHYMHKHTCTHAFTHVYTHTHTHMHIHTHVYTQARSPIVLCSMCQHWVEWQMLKWTLSYITPTLWNTLPKDPIFSVGFFCQISSQNSPFSSMAPISCVHLCACACVLCDD